MSYRELKSKNNEINYAQIADKVYLVTNRLINLSIHIKLCILNDYENVELMDNLSCSYSIKEAGLNSFTKCILPGFCKYFNYIEESKRFLLNFEKLHSRFYLLMKLNYEIKYEDCENNQTDSSHFKMNKEREISYILGSPTGLITEYFLYRKYYNMFWNDGEDLFSVDYYLQNILKSILSLSRYCKMDLRFLLVLLYNPNHDPDTGRFLPKGSEVSPDKSQVIVPGTKPIPVSVLTSHQRKYYMDKLKCDENLIKYIRTVEEAEIYVKAGLYQYNVDQYVVLMPDLDINSCDEYNISNYNLLKGGKNPVTKDGLALYVHHIGQRNNSPWALLTKEQHYDGNTKILHPDYTNSDIDRNKFKVDRIKYFKLLLSHKE